MTNKIKIAIIECYPNRAELIKNKMLEILNSKNQIDVFKSYENIFPDFEYDMYIISGGIITLDEKEKYPYLYKIEDFVLEIEKKNKVLLGVCLGHQIIAEAFGGKIEESEELEVGFQKINILIKDKIFKKSGEYFYAFNYHGYYVSKIPKNFKIIAKSNLCPTQVIKHKQKPIYGFQFHIEYDEKNSIEVLEYLKDEIIKEGYNFSKVLKQNDLFIKEKIDEILRELSTLK